MHALTPLSASGLRGSDVGSRKASLIAVRRRGLRTTMLLLLLCAATASCSMHSSPATSIDQQQPTPAVRIQLDELRARYSTAYDQGDAEAIGTLYADSAIRMPYDAVAQRGRQAIVAAARESFSRRRFAPVLTLAPDDLILRGDVAVERGAYHELQRFNSGGAAREDGKYIFVAVSRAGAWVYLWSTFNRDSAAHRF